MAELVIRRGLSGKTFTMAKVIEQPQHPASVAGIAGPVFFGWVYAVSTG